MENIELFVKDNQQLFDIADYIIYDYNIVKQKAKLRNTPMNVGIIIARKNNVMIIKERGSLKYFQLLRFDEDKLNLIKSLDVYDIDKDGFVIRK